ncbi:hypothetical protein ACGF5S_32875 [Nocardia nova]|uniref:hypothetical protein n=1 Tax=Nocardia nova TaxID=37330 RepID=UPI00370FD2A2
MSTQLDTARQRLELLGGDSAALLTEVPSEAELHADRELAEWRRSELRKAQRAELADQLAAAESLRRAGQAIREADIRDAVDARKALAAQRRAETPASTVAELHRYSRWTRYACGAIIGAGMVWGAVNVQHNMAPGGMSDPLFWASFLIEGMISGLLVIIALGSAKVRDSSGLEPSGNTRLVEGGLLALTFALNTYPYLKATHWYDALTHAIAPGMIAMTLLALHSLGSDYARARSEVSKRITGPVELPHLPAVERTVAAAEHLAEQRSTYRPAEQLRSTAATEQAQTALQAAEQGAAAAALQSSHEAQRSTHTVAAEQPTDDGAEEPHRATTVEAAPAVAETFEVAEAIGAHQPEVSATAKPEPIRAEQPVATAAEQPATQRSTGSTATEQPVTEAAAEHPATATEQPAEHLRSTPDSAEHPAPVVAEQRSTPTIPAEHSGTGWEFATEVQQSTGSRLPVERIATVLERHDATGDGASRIARDLGMGFAAVDRVLAGAAKIRAERNGRVIPLRQG